MGFIVLRIKAHLTIVVGLLLIGATSAQALDFTLDQSYGQVAASGSVSMSFVDSAVDEVTLTIDSTDLDLNTEFIKFVYFGYTGDATQLTFGTASGSASDALTLPISTDANQVFPAGGGGLYSVFMEFETDKAARFNIDEQLIITISGVGGLTMQDFNVLSAKDGGNGLFFATAKINATGNGNGSDWLGAAPIPAAPIPEPSAAILFIAGALVVSRSIRLRR